MEDQLRTRRLDKETKQRKVIPSEVFVVAWNSSNSLQEVAEKTGKSPHYCQSRAGNLRYLKGLPLKSMSFQRKRQRWSNVMKLAKEALVMGSLLLLAICSQSSVITLDWDPNPETNLTGYRLFASTSVSMVSMSTQAAVANNRITKILLPVTTTYSAFIPAGTTYYTRLTARNSNGESGFNVDSGGNPHELLVWLKPGDVNKDGTVGIVDLSMLIAYWNETNRREADFNNDGLVGIVDLSILIASWGQ